ncbi:hypothetical protein FSOLCH5_009963 [Fusarium solani]
MSPTEPPEEGQDEEIFGQENAATEDETTPQLPQGVNRRDGELDTNSDERPQEPPEAPREKRKAGRHTANTKRRRTTGNVLVDAVQPPRRSGRIYGLNHRDTLERPVEGEAIADDVRDLVSAVLSREAIQRFAEAVNHSKKPQAERARKPLDEIDLEDGDPAYRPIALRGRQLSYSEERTTFERIFTRYDQLQYALGYQALKDERGYDKLPPNIVTEVCRMNGVTWFEAVDQGEQFMPSEDVDWDSLEEGDVLEALARLTAITEA